MIIAFGEPLLFVINNEPEPRLITCQEMSPAAMPG
jgi:hypothetical protein